MWVVNREGKGDSVTREEGQTDGVKDAWKSHRETIVYKLT